MTTIQNFERLIKASKAHHKTIAEIDRLSSMLMQAKDLAEIAKSEGLTTVMELYQAHAENTAQALKNIVSFTLQDILK